MPEYARCRTDCRDVFSCCVKGIDLLHQYFTCLQILRTLSATGVQHTVREFTTLAFHYAGIELEWQGSGIHEKGINKANGKVVVEVSEAFYRPTDVVDLWGDPQKARTVLGWNPQKTSYEELCRLMAEHDLKLAKAEAIMLQETEK